MRGTFAGALLAGSLLVVAGCSGSGPDDAAPAPRPSTSASQTAPLATPSPTDQPRPQQTLTALLTQTTAPRTLVYHVTGALEATVTLRESGPSRRLDVASPQGTSSLYTGPTSTALCTDGACVPRPTGSAGSALDDELGRDLIGALATAQVSTSSAGPDGATCFALQDSSATEVCVRPDGVITRLVYPSGQLALASEGPGPAASDLTPPPPPR